MQRAEPSARSGSTTEANAVQRLVPALGGVMLVVFLVAPRTAPVLAPLLAILPLAWGPPALDRADLRAPAMLAGLLLGAYLLVNATWAVDRGDAFGKALFYWALLGLAWVAWRGARSMPPEALTTVPRALTIAFAAAIAFLLFEELTHHLVKRTLYNVLPFIRPSEKHIRLDGGLIDKIEFYTTNRNMAALTLALAPMLLAARVWRIGGRTWVASALLLAGVLLTVFSSDHESSKMGLILAALAFAVALYSRKLAIALIGAGWLVATLLVVPIVSQAYARFELHKNQSLPKSFKHRIILWGYTAEEVMKTPLRGVGISSGKILDEQRTGKWEQPADHIYPRRTGTHSHNIYLQTWYELGAIGALLLAAFGLALLAAIHRLPAAAIPYGLATFSAAAAIGAFSWGLWQPWFMATFGMAAVLLGFSAALQRSKDIE